MTHLITQSCCSDASCVPACPVDAIHPTPQDPDYAHAEMLYIDPVACIDCGACVDVCPVDAIVTDDELPPELALYEELNAQYYTVPRAQSPAHKPASPERVEADDRILRVAIVGSGPSACYTAHELLTRGGPAVEVAIFEKLPTPFGLLRFGVAPDHQATKSVARLFQKTISRRNVDIYLNVEIGKHLTHADLLHHHDAVVYAVGAPGDHKLGITGEDLPGSHSATEFVAWYNGHPDHTDHQFDLTTERAVIIGNGNVALDVARILVSSPEELAKTDIADHALAALSDSNIKEVVVVGRRGPAQAAFTTPELLGLDRIPGVQVVVPPGEADLDDPTSAWIARHPDPIVAMKTRLLEGHSTQTPEQTHKRITLRFLRSPVAILGSDHVTGAQLVRNELIESHGTMSAQPTESVESLDCGLVFRSVGYMGAQVAGLPVHGPRATLRNERGRVLDPHLEGQVTSVYTVGWIKRGPTGVIGSNKNCAAETVTSILDDFAAGRLPRPGGDRQQLQDLVRRRQPDLIDIEGWKTIDSYERRAGRVVGRPRVKLVDRQHLLSVATGGIR
ncbi:ferredoxin [Rhodococcus sp. 14-2686-1-2]|nr:MULTISPECIES: 4Fe-4S binding protein [unclassified Rhodococcus (in: high G+C Gram-positive bacteria)]OZE93565.1 ferredoxin [Rhodococcus sp. 15-1189-1-1a]OZF08491.1 ferredoxin [Rhodococcus sp. 14-2686-1-2]